MFTRLGRPAHLWTIRPSGADLRQLTSGSQSQWNPAWSPDRRHLSFLQGPRPYNAQGAIDILDLKTDQVTRLVHGGGTTLLGETAWSPTGAWLAFDEPVGESSGGIFRIRPNGTGLRRIAAGWQPTWSPDGRAIAYARVDSSSRIAMVGSQGGRSIDLTHPAYPTADGWPNWQPR